jgi:capsular polysaccharide export protein
MKVLFLALAKHQKNYFQSLLDSTELRGRVVVPAELPFPELSAIGRAMTQVDWHALIEEKCRERAVKKRYHGWLYRLLLRLELLVMALRFAALLDKERADAVAVWNGGHRYCSLLTSMCGQEVRTFYFENGLLPNTTTLDPRGVNYRNSLPRNGEFYRDYARSHPVMAAGEEGVRLIPRKPRVEGGAPVELPEHFIFIPFQDDRDTQVRLFSPWVRDMRELFALAERLVSELGVAVVLKEHPSSRETYPDLHERVSDRLFFANQNSTQQLIESSQLVITLNSTVGLESILLGKPVLTLGQAFYNIDGLVLHGDNAGEVIELIRQNPGWQPDAEMRKGFLAYLQNEYCVPGAWASADQMHWLEVARRMQQS